MFGIGSTEMIVFGIIAVILFGGRLPSVARSLGKSIVEFKKGMKDIEDDLKSSIYSEPENRISYEDESQPTSPKFEPPKEEKQEEHETVAAD
jgi:sec-independent protein translocase protein TatA